MALSTRENPRPGVGATRARQGRLGRHVFWVLLFGTLLAALALFGAWTWRSGDLAESAVDERRANPDATLFDAPEPQPINPSAAQKQTTPANPGPTTP